MADLVRRLAVLSPRQRTLLARRLTGQRSPSSEPQRLPRGPGVNTFRASFGQERLWVLERVLPGSAVHNLAMVFRTVGWLDLRALRQSLETVIARHESLRTTFAVADGVPLQVVSPAAVVSMPVVDARRCGGTEDARTSWVHDAVARAIERPFDLTHGPLVRAGVFVLSETVQVLHVSLHHLIADAWSATILVRELAEAYRACLEGRLPRLSRVELQYADYAQWQRERCRGAWRESLIAYWRRQLEGAAYPAIQHARPRLERSLRGAVHRCEVPPALAEAARALARREGITFFVLLLATWQVCIRRWTGSADVTVLAPIANRTRPAVAEVIGFFVNLVALRVRVDDDLRFRALLRLVRDVLREAHAHQELPFEMVVKHLEADRALSRPPISPVGFALERGDLDVIHVPGAGLHAVELDATTSKSDVTLVVREATRGTSARLEYRVDVFDADTIARMLAEVVSCLTRAVGDPDQRISELAAGPVERRRGRQRPPGVMVWERFADQAARSPEAVAVRAGREIVTYSALAARALGVAGKLHARGVGRDTIVGVWGDRGVALLGAMLGILRAGAVYLPLDPRAPAARIAQVLRQSEARIVLTGSEPPAPLLAARGDGASWALVAMDAASEAPPGEAHGEPDDLAYVLYTSGSTGEPKGAMVEHAGLLNHLDAKIALLDLQARDRVAQTAAAGFDISVWQYLAALLVGGRVEVVSDAEARDPRRLRMAVAHAGVTVLEIVPAQLRVLLEAESAAESRALETLRWLVVTGDTLTPELCREWLRRYPGVPLVNAYGPTECADDVTHHLVRTPPEAGALRVPIGRPIANTAVHVLDAQLVPVATGEVGELCVGGIGVGRGYLHDPARTAAAFVPDPFDARPGARLYRTGDRGRRLPDGTLEHLGRLDQQVKIRGMRIEPGEIEAVLLQHPAVRQAAVVASVDHGTDLTLTAYVVVLDAASEPAAMLRQFLGERLPESMIPAGFVLLDALPLGPNGKVDRRALRDVPVSRPAAPARLRPPTTPIERVLTDIWCDVLQVEVRSVDDDFFALGGDSLSSLRVVAQASRQGILLTPQQIFECRTIASLAFAATTVVSPPSDQGLVVGRLELTPIQRMLFAADLPDVHHYNMAALLEVEERLVPALMEMAVERLLHHHDALRLRFTRDGADWRATVAGLDGVIPYSHVDLSFHADAEVECALEASADRLQASLDLAAGPIVRVASFDLGPDRSGRLLIVVHHLACDVVSWPILLEDLASLYDQLGRGDAIALPAKTMSVQRWAQRLLEYGRQPERANDLGFWQRECGGPCVRLPRDLAGSGAAIADVDVVRSVLGGAETEMIRAFAAASHVSIEVVLLTGLATTLAEHAGSEAVMVYLERHGREAVFPDLDVSRTVGWFTAVFPVRVPVGARHQPGEALALVDRHLREIPVGGIGYGVLQYGPGPADASLRDLPRPEVSFNYLGGIDPPRQARWRRASESAGREVGIRGVRPTILDVTAHIADATLRVAWRYSPTLHRRATIERLAGRLCDVVRELVTGEACRQPDVAGLQTRGGAS